MALVSVPADTIASVNEQSQSAVEARRAFAPVVAEMLEEFGYDAAISRAALAPTTNPRLNEWAYAFALPANLAAPLKLLPANDAVAGSVVLLAGQTLAPSSAFAGIDPYRIHYEIAEDTLFANEPNAVLEYVRDDPSVALFSAMFIRAVALEMAARMVMPLLKDSKREAALMVKAENAKQRAVAANLNRKPNTAYIPLTEDERARTGDY